jgi:hypothetical protein
VIEKLPRCSLYAFAALLPLHNLVMAELWDLGVRDFALDVVSAWKEVLLALALGAIVWRQRGIPFKATPTDYLALAYAVVVLLYALIPQDWLGGDASARGVLYALRHDLTPVAAYFLGRGLTLGAEQRRRLGLTILVAAAFVAAWGLFDIYAISLQTWRDSGVPGWFHEQLGLDYRGLSYLPENWVYNPGDEHPLRRLVSTFLSPLATAYMLLVAILLAATWQRSRWLTAMTALLGVGLLFTYSRTSIAALAVGLCALAYALRTPWALAAAAVLLATGFFFVKTYPDIAPETRFTKAELQIQRAGGREDSTSSDPFSSGESSIDSHLDSLRDGIDTVVHHPQGYGLGNAGVTAKRTGVEIKAGESTYTELGVELGLLGVLAFVAWSVLLARVTLRRAPWLGASLVAILALGIQTDVIGVHWLAFVVWALAGERA